MHALVQPGAVESCRGRRAQADRRRGPPLHRRDGRRRHRDPVSWCRPGPLTPAHCLSSRLAWGPPQRRLRPFRHVLRSHARSLLLGIAVLRAQRKGIMHLCPPWGTNQRGREPPQTLTTRRQPANPTGPGSCSIVSPDCHRQTHEPTDCCLLVSRKFSA